MAVQNLNIGGVQSAFINYLKCLYKTGKYDIHVFSFSNGCLQAKIPSGVTVEFGGKALQLSATPFGEIKKSGRAFDILFRVLITLLAKMIGTERFYRLCFKKQKEKYDIAVSYFTDVPAGVFNKGTNQYVAEYVQADKKVAYIHTDPILAGFDKNYCRKIYDPFDKIV